MIEIIVAFICVLMLITLDIVCHKHNEHKRNNAINAERVKRLAERGVYMTDTGFIKPLNKS